MSLVLVGHPSCREIVELVTEYDEGGMSDADRLHLEEHLAICLGCLRYREQLHEVGELVRSVEQGAGEGEGELDPALEAMLLAALESEWGRR